MAETAGRRRASVGVLFWIAFILLVLVIFLANRSNISQVLDSTGIVEVIRNRVARDETAPDGNAIEEPLPTDTPVEDPTPMVTRQPTRVTVEGEGAPVAEDPASGEPARTTTVAEEPSRVSQPPAQDPVRSADKPNTRMAALYFIRVTDDGRTYAQRVVRPVAYGESPLTETIRTLIAGPTGEELDEGLLNLIPAQTELLSAHVANGVAYLNFNQSFRFNPMGAEGTVAQLQQIIYSSTEFPTVTRVQFLIDGEKIDYVGGDGIYIGEPLGRDAFSS